MMAAPFLETDIFSGKASKAIFWQGAEQSRRPPCLVRETAPPSWEPPYPPWVSDFPNRYHNGGDNDHVLIR
jgi:hypothetical protein